MSHTINTEVKFLPGEKCLVRNYKKKSPDSWEPGTVQIVRIDVSQDGTSSPAYDVLLDRRSVTKKKPWGGPIWLYVGNDKVAEI